METGHYWENRTARGTEAANTMNQQRQKETRELNNSRGQPGQDTRG